MKDIPKAALALEEALPTKVELHKGPRGGWMFFDAAKRHPGAVYATYARTDSALQAENERLREALENLLDWYERGIPSGHPNSQAVREPARKALTQPTATGRNDDE